MDEPEDGWVDEEQTGAWAEERDWRSGEWGTFVEDDEEISDTAGAD